MIDFTLQRFNPCKEWIADMLHEGRDINSIAQLCVAESEMQAALLKLKDDYCFPPDMTLDEWISFYSSYRESIKKVMVATKAPELGIDAGEINNISGVPGWPGSTWVRYKNSLLHFGEKAIEAIEDNCFWILQHLKFDTRVCGATKGLVMGSVQSGKTTIMEGLVSMAADYDWNFFIILSGTIENLRIQTRDRFADDLQKSEGVMWKIIDFNTNDKDLQSDELTLNIFGQKTFGRRYVTVCLKNRKRLESLIDWLYSNDHIAGKLRVLIIDDEADQASINTREITPEEEQERCAINQLIVNLANGKKSDGSNPRIKIQAINYLSFTATPYANVLNESSEESLYPKDYILSLPESNEYFGVKVIFGNDEVTDCHGLNIVRDIPLNDLHDLKAINAGTTINNLPNSFKRSIAWFICASAVLRFRNHEKPISMLIHTSARQNEHFNIYNAIKLWMASSSTVLSFCEKIYDDEKSTFSLADLAAGFSDYGRLADIIEEYPLFTEISDEIKDLLSNINSIFLTDEGELIYHNGIHICVDNCKANYIADDNEQLRIIYPSKEQCTQIKKAPVFMVIGGNTLSRGLTIEGLVCTYFSRDSRQADTLMQMARWFGFRRGYELLQRIWMSQAVVDNFELLAKIDMDLKTELEVFKERGLSPSMYGPRIRNTPGVLKITAKRKSQMMEDCDYDFGGNSYETTKFDTEPNVLINQIKITEEFLRSIGKPRLSDTASAIVWDNVPYSVIKVGYLQKFIFSDSSPLKNDMPIFMNWMDQMVAEGKFSEWNIAVAGDGSPTAKQWEVFQGFSVGYIERSRKRGKDFIDIGSLRSGRDAICDILVSSLTAEQKKLVSDIKRKGSNLISSRNLFNLGNTPLLLIYRIDKDLGKESKTREKISTPEDIIGISVIVPGEETGKSIVKTVRIIINN